MMGMVWSNNADCQMPACCLMKWWSTSEPCILLSAEAIGKCLFTHKMWWIHQRLWDCYTVPLLRRYLIKSLNHHTIWSRTGGMMWYSSGWCCCHYDILLHFATVNLPCFWRLASRFRLLIHSCRPQKSLCRWQREWCALISICCLHNL